MRGFFRLFSSSPSSKPPAVFHSFHGSPVLHLLRRDDDGNGQVGVRRRGTPVLQVQTQRPESVLERRWRRRRCRRPPGAAGDRVHRTVLGRGTRRGDQAQGPGRQDKVPQRQTVAGQTLTQER